LKVDLMCNLYSITTNQAAIIALFRVINRYVGNLPPMPGVFPDYPAPVVRNTDHGTELTTMRWGMPRKRVGDEARRAWTWLLQQRPVMG
jgi:putative SOS response-associated peptidase YedK